MKIHDQTYKKFKDSKNPYFQNKTKFKKFSVWCGFLCNYLDFMLRATQPNYFSYLPLVRNVGRRSASVRRQCVVGLLVGLFPFSEQEIFIYIYIYVYYAHNLSWRCLQSPSHRHLQMHSQSQALVDNNDGSASSNAFAKGVAKGFAHGFANIHYDIHNRNHDTTNHLMPGLLTAPKY